MVQTANQRQIKLNRITSLKERFTDRYFTIIEAAEFLNIKPNTMWDVLRVAISDRLICKKREGRGHVYKFVPENFKSLDDVVKESALLDGIRDGSIPPQTQAPAAKRLLAAAREEGFASPALDRLMHMPIIKSAPAPAPALPNILEVNGVKYVRMDRIAEVLLDQL